MRVVLQRVTSASVSVDGEVTGAIERGYLLLTAIAEGDTSQTVERMAVKIAELRLFPDNAPAPGGRFDRSLLDVTGAALVVSQFTLLADTRRGRRPSFTSAAAPDVAERLVDEFAQRLRDRGVTVASGVFGAKMQVTLVNDGPVTIVLDSADLDRPRSA